MLMSKSRLEKFLYALYSLDSSDLPTPLSRIEELYKCLVTGEEPPTFEPLSRVEKYLMAILGVYDVELLPNPLSRVEVLLYKLAIGDENLDDVKSFLSEHEELLAEIIRNGGAGGNIDIEYVLYTLSTEFNTLYNTAEKPVKSAVLKGNTLVNTWKKHNTLTPINFTLHDDGFMELNYPILYFDHIQTDSSLIKPNTKYLLIVEAKNNTIPVSTFLLPDARTVFLDAGWVELFTPKENGVRKVILTSSSDFSTTTNDMRWGVYISFDQSSIPENERGIISVRQMLIEYQEGMENWDIPYLEGIQSVKMPVLTTSNEDGTKSNILTVNEEVELRGVGDVQDELNLLTGEVTQRIGEVVLNGSEIWTQSGYMSTNCYCAFTSVQGSKNKFSTNIICDSLPTKDILSSEVDSEGCVFNNSLTSAAANVVIKIAKSKLSSATIDGLKTYLQSNPITIQYELASESVKTVDLSAVDQDGNDTKLSTFNDITHVTLSSEGLIPEAELEVATKNEEVLNTMSLEMDDIYATQNALQETSDTQSENVDATMIATTEIYEGLL